jgi:hypothetical protein
MPGGPRDEKRPADVTRAGPARPTVSSPRFNCGDGSHRSTSRAFPKFESYATFETAAFCGSKCAVVVIVLGGWMLAARAGNETNEPAVIAEWSPIIPAVACNFPNRDGTVTTLVGSGMLVRGASGALGVVASAAVLSPEGKVADACYVTFQDGPSYTILSADIHADPQLTLTGVSAIQLEDNQC